MICVPEVSAQPDTSGTLANERPRDGESGSAFPDSVARGSLADLHGRDPNSSDRAVVVYGQDAAQLAGHRVLASILDLRGIKYHQFWFWPHLVAEGRRQGVPPAATRSPQPRRAVWPDYGRCAGRAGAGASAGFLHAGAGRYHLDPGDRVFAARAAVPTLGTRTPAVHR